MQNTRAAVKRAQAKTERAGWWDPPWLHTLRAFVPPAPSHAPSHAPATNSAHKDCICADV